MDESQKNLPLQQKDLPLPEKELPAPHDMLLPKPTFWDKHASSLHPILMVLIFSFLVADIAYFFFIGLRSNKQTNIQPSPTLAETKPSPTPTDSTANWETFTNEAFGYQIKHPNLTDNLCNQGSISKFDTFTAGLSDGPFLPNLGSCGYYSLAFFVNNTNTKSIAEKINTFISSTEGIYATKTDFITEDTLLGNIKAKKVSIKGKPEIIYYFFKNDKNSRIYYIYIEHHDQGKHLLQINQILSTFKFLDQTPSPTGQVFCTQDAKLCSDGSSVGRTGPNCEFEACP